MLDRSWAEKLRTPNGASGAYGGRLNRIACLGCLVFLLCFVPMAAGVMPVTVIVSGATSVAAGKAVTLRARSYHGFLPYRKYVWSAANATPGDTGDGGALTDQHDHGVRNEASAVLYTAPLRSGYSFKITVTVTDDAGNVDTDTLVIRVE